MNAATGRFSNHRTSDITKPAMRKLVAEVLLVFTTYLKGRQILSRRRSYLPVVKLNNNSPRDEASGLVSLPVFLWQQRKTVGSAAETTHLKQEVAVWARKPVFKVFWRELQAFLSPYL